MLAETGIDYLKLSNEKRLYSFSDAKHLKMLSVADPTEYAPCCSRILAGFHCKCEWPFVTMNYSSGKSLISLFTKGL